MDQNESRKLGSKKRDPDSPNEIGDQPGPPCVEYVHLYHLNSSANARWRQLFQAGY
jgi:hypothetical protein